MPPARKRREQNFMKIMDAFDEWLYELAEQTKEGTKSD